VNEDVHAQLHALGIPGYEAKAYLSLLQLGGPANGYEIAKASGVPRSAVYETLNKLVRRGIVFEVRGVEDQVQYVPLPGDSLVARLRRDFNDTIDDLGPALTKTTGPSSTRLIHHLEGPAIVMDRLVDLVEAARDTIHVTAWPDQMERLEPALAAAEARGVDVWVHAWGGIHPQLSKVYSNPLTDPKSKLDRAEWIDRRLGTRLLVVVTDHTEMISVGSMDKEVWGIYTDDPAAVLIGLEAIVHYIVSDVTIQAIGPDNFLTMFESDPLLMRLVTGARGGGARTRRKSQRTAASPAAKTTTEKSETPPKRS
jgi:sugar-specific transcriptional regulator TrmB